MLVKRFRIRTDGEACSCIEPEQVVAGVQRVSGTVCCQLDRGHSGPHRSKRREWEHRAAESRPIGVEMKRWITDRERVEFLMLQAREYRVGMYKTREEIDAGMRDWEHGKNAGKVG